MSKHFLVIQDSFNFKRGDIIEGNIGADGLLLENKVVAKKHLICLTENLSAQDQDKVREIIRDMLKKFLWRAYTRNQFLLQ